MNAPSEARQSLTVLSNEADAINLRNRKKIVNEMVFFNPGSNLMITSKTYFTSGEYFTSFTTF